MKKLLGYALLFLLLFPIAAEETFKRDQDVNTKFLEVWKGIPESGNGCGGYDYFPGGLRSFYCHLKTLISFQLLNF